MRIGELLRLTQVKEEAVAQLRAAAERYSREDYSEENWERLLSIAETYISQAECVVGEGEIALAVSSGTDEMADVPKEGQTIPPDPEPDPDPDPEPDPDPGTGGEEKPPVSFWEGYGRWIAVGAAAAVVAAGTAFVIVWKKRR